MKSVKINIFRAIQFLISLIKQLPELGRLLASKAFRLINFSLCVSELDCTEWNFYTVGPLSWLNSLWFIIAESANPICISRRTLAGSITRYRETPGAFSVNFFRSIRSRTWLEPWVARQCVFPTLAARRSRSEWKRRSVSDFSWQRSVQPVDCDGDTGRYLETDEMSGNCSA